MLISFYLRSKKFMIWNFMNTLIDIVSKNVCIATNLNIRLLIVYTLYIYIFTILIRFLFDLY